MSNLVRLFKSIEGFQLDTKLVLREGEESNDRTNQAAWRFFARAAKACPREIIQKMEKRYHFSLNPNNKTPLCVKHILALQVTIADVRREDLKGNLTKAEIGAQFHPDIPREKPAFKLRGGVPMDRFLNFVFPKKVARDSKRLQLYSGIEKLSWGAFLERLSKAIISHPLEKGMIIPSPDHVDFPTGEKDYYEIVHMAHCDGLGVCALAPIAKDSNLPPIILFQPMQLTVNCQGMLTILNNVEPNLGQTGYRNSKAMMSQIMKDPRFSDGNAVLSGYSLGGNHAQRLLRDYPTHFSGVAIFNSAGVTDERVALDFAEMVNDPSWNKPMEIIYYRTVFIDKEKERHDDLTTGFGGKFAGFGVRNPLVNVRVVELHYQTPHISIGRVHVKRCLDCDPSKTKMLKVVEIPRNQIDAQLDNTLRPGLLGKVEAFRRKVLSNIAYPFFRFLWAICKSCIGALLEILFKENGLLNPA